MSKKKGKIIVKGSPTLYPASYEYSDGLLTTRIEIVLDIATPVLSSPRHLFLLDNGKVGLAAEVEGLPTPGTLEHRYLARLLMQILKIRTSVIIIMGF